MKCMDFRMLDRFPQTSQIIFQRFEKIMHMNKQYRFLKMSFLIKWSKNEHFLYSISKLVWLSLMKLWAQLNLSSFKLQVLGTVFQQWKAKTTTMGNYRRKRNGESPGLCRHQSLRVKESPGRGLCGEYRLNPLWELGEH